MHKNFEEEYHKSIEESVPDLWGRISAGIDALEGGAAVNTMAQENVVPFQARTKAKNHWWKRYGGVVVAAAVLVIAIPVVLLAQNAGGRKKSETATGMYFETESITVTAEYEECDSVDTVYTNEAQEEADAEESYYETESAETTCEEAACESAAVDEGVMYIQVIFEVQKIEGEELTVRFVQETVEDTILQDVESLLVQYVPADYPDVQEGTTYEAYIYSDGNSWFLNEILGNVTTE